MSLQIDKTPMHCSFCRQHAVHSELVRSMYGLYCTNEHCYSRVASGNLVPASTCSQCSENSFYFEADGTMDTAAYQCIACGHVDALD